MLRAASIEFLCGPTCRLLERRPEDTVRLCRSMALRRDPAHAGHRSHGPFYFGHRTGHTATKPTTSTSHQGSSIRKMILTTGRKPKSHLNDASKRQDVRVLRESLPVTDSLFGMMPTTEIIELSWKSPARVWWMPSQRCRSPSTSSCRRICVTTSPGYGCRTHH